MRNRAGADIGDDLHIRMRMRRKTRLRRDQVVIPNPNVTPVHPGWVMITRK